MDTPEWSWWQKLLPYYGMDEWGRHTIVLPWPTGYIVIALWKCHDPEVVDSVRQWEEELKNP